MKVAVLHHVQKCWEAGLRNHAGVSLHKWIRAIAKHLHAKQYDKVILTMFDAWQLEDIHEPISEFISEIHEYGFGWDKWAIPPKERVPYARGEIDRGTGWVEGGSHSNIVMVDPWMHTLKLDTVTTIGCFRGECLEDIEIALTNGAGVRQYQEHPTLCH